MVFYGLIAALTVAMAYLMSAVPGKYGAGGLRADKGVQVRQEEDTVFPHALAYRSDGGAQSEDLPARRTGSAAGRSGCGGLTRRRAFDWVCLSGIFLTLSLTAALRVEVGNDYGKYVDIFHEIWAGTDAAYVVTEPGFNFVVRAVYTLSGYENYLLVFALFGTATAFLFLRAMYGQSESFVLSFFMFMTLGLYFRTFTTVRYYFVLALVMCSLRHVLRREYGKFVLTVLFAALFHKSVLVVIPLFLLARLRWERRVCAAGAVLAVLVFVLRRQVLSLALLLYPTFRDTVYLSQDVGLRANASGILRCLALFALAFFCREGLKKEENRFYLKLSVLGFLLYTCGSFLPLVSRLAYYAVTPQILLAPGLTAAVGDGRKKRLATAVLVLFCLLYFVQFLRTASGSGIQVLPYRSWIFYGWEWINGSEFF